MNPQQYGQNYMGPPLSTFPPSYVSHNYGPTSNTFNNCYPSQQQPAYGAVYSPVAPLPAFQYHHPNENPYFSQAGPCHHPSANPHFSQAGPCHHPSANPHFSQAEPCRHPYGNPQFTQAGPCHHPAPSCHYDHRGERYEPQTFPPSHAAQAYFFNDQYRGAESLRQQPFADNHQVQQPPTIRMGFDDSSNPNTRARPHATTDLRPQAQSFIPRSNRVHKTKTKASGRVVELQDERNNDNPRHDDGKQDGLSGQPSLSLPRKPEKVVPWKRRRGNTPTKTSPQAKRHSKVPIPATCVSSQTNEAQQSVTPSVTPQSLQNGSRSKLLTHGSSSARAKNRDSGNLGLEQDLTKSSSTLQTSLTGSESRLLTHGSLPAPVGNRDSGNSGTEQDLSKPSSTSHAPSGGSQSNLLGCGSLSARVRNRDSDNLGREQSLHQTRPKHESLQTRHQAFVSDNDPPSSQAVTCCPAGIHWQETEHITPSPYTNLLLFAERSAQRFSSGLAVTECISIITNQTLATTQTQSPGKSTSAGTETQTRASTQAQPREVRKSAELGRDVQTLAPTSDEVAKHELLGPGIQDSYPARTKYEVPSLVGNTGSFDFESLYLQNQRSLRGISEPESSRSGTALREDSTFHMGRQSDSPRFRPRRQVGEVSQLDLSDPVLQPPSISFFQDVPAGPASNESLLTDVAKSQVIPGASVETPNDKPGEEMPSLSVPPDNKPATSASSAPVEKPDLRLSQHTLDLTEGLLNSTITYSSVQNADQSKATKGTQDLIYYAREKSPSNSSQSDFAPDANRKIAKKNKNGSKKTSSGPKRSNDGSQNGDSRSTKDKPQQSSNKTPGVLRTGESPVAPPTSAAPMNPVAQDNSTPGPDDNIVASAIPDHNPETHQVVSSLEILQPGKFLWRRILQPRTILSDGHAKSNRPIMPPISPPVLPAYGTNGGSHIEQLPQDIFRIIAEQLRYPDRKSFMASSHACHAQMAPCVAYLFPASFKQPWSYTLAEVDKTKSHFWQRISRPVSHNSTKKLQQLSTNEHPTIVAVVWPMRTGPIADDFTTYFEVFAALLRIRSTVRLEFINCDQITLKQIVESKMAGFPNLRDLALYGCNRVSFDELFESRVAIRSLPFKLDLVLSELYFHSDWAGTVRAHIWRLALRRLHDMPDLYPVLPHLFEPDSLFFRHFMVQLHGMSYFTHSNYPEICTGALNFREPFVSHKIDYRNPDGSPAQAIFTRRDILNEQFMAVSNYYTPSTTESPSYDGLNKAWVNHIALLGTKAKWLVAGSGPKGFCKDDKIPKGKERLALEECWKCEEKMTIHVFADAQLKRDLCGCIDCEAVQPIQQSIEWRLNRKWRGDDDVVPFVNHRLMDVGTVYDEESFLVWLAGGAKGSRPADPRPSFLEDKP